MHRPSSSSLFLVLLAVGCFGAPVHAGGVTSCKTQGYSTDKDPNGLNVRAGPGSSHKVIGRLKRVNDGGYYIWPEMDITGSSGKWLRISSATAGLDGDTIFKGTGWVHVSRVATASRGYSDGHVVLRGKRNGKSAAVAKVPRESDVRIAGCNGAWVLGEYKGKRGWLAPGDQCGTAATTCN